MTHPDWEPFITGIAFFAGLIGLEFSETKSIKNSPDIKLFNKLIGLLPSATLIEFLKNKDFGAAFQNDYLDPLRDFNIYWDNAEHEFMNGKLEKKRKELLLEIDEFLDYLAHNTWPLRNGIQSIPAEWEEDQPERWERTKNELNRLSDRIVIIHQDLVRLAKKELHV